MSRNSDFDQQLSLPLGVSWEKSVPPLRFGSSQIVGAKGRVFVTTGEKDIQAIDSKSGSVHWESKNCRVEDAYLFYVADRVWVMNGPDGVVFDGSNGTGKKLEKLNFFRPAGIYREDSETLVRVEQGHVRVSDLSFEEDPKFGAALSVGANILGFFRQDGVAKLSCFDVGLQEFRWILDPGEGRFGAVVSASKDLFLTVTHGEIVAHSTKAGSRIWAMQYEFQLRGLGFPNFVISEDLVFMRHGVDAWALDAKTGELRWKLDLKDARPTNMIGTRGLIWVGICARESRKKDRLVALDKRTGEEVWSLPVKGKFVGDYPLSFIDGSLICAIGRTITCFRPEAA